MASEIGEGLGWLAGSGIALLTLLIPLGSVLMDRGDPLASPQPGATTTRMAATTLAEPSLPLDGQRSAPTTPFSGRPQR